MDENSYMVSLLDGSVVDISTKEGGNAVLEGVFDRFSSKLKKFRKLRKEKRLNARDQKKELFWSISYLAKCADRETFQAKIPESEIQDLMDFFVEEIKSFTEKRSWISTGRLHINDYEILLACGDFLSNWHAVPVLLAFESDFFQVLTSFIKARKDHGGRALPHVSICTVIGKIVLRTFSTADCDFDNWSKEKIFKKFEASGILEQILRCSTVPLERVSSDDYFNQLLKVLEYCPSILTRKFKNGPCQIRGIHGSIEFKANLPFGKCRHCSKNGDVEEPLFWCSQCQVAYYCSRKCQKAAWENHKFCCEEMNKAEREKHLARMIATRRIMDQHSETVFQAMDEKYRSSGVGPLAVEVSFMPNENGIIPAFHDPPTFRIVRFRDYISGQDKPEWLRTDGVWESSFYKIKYMLEKGMNSYGALVICHADCIFVDGEIMTKYRNAGNQVPFSP